MKSEAATRAPSSAHGPRPLFAFLVSLAISSVLMGVLLLSDRRVLELRRARSEVQLLDRQIVERRQENEALRNAIESANKHEFPAERSAREELHLVSPDDVVLLYPPGSLTTPATRAAAGQAVPLAPVPTPAPAAVPRAR